MALPTLYQYYHAGGITSGLSADNGHFTLNERNITLYSGSMHYFRVPQEYWRDRLRKMRAAGLNVVDTYVPWNLHEPEPGTFDFGFGGTDFQDFLNIQKFLQIAQEEDLFTIIRPGPYICAEWEFGGLPSWLLRDRSMLVRRSDPVFMKHVAKYFSALFSILVLFQFTLGGSIIGFQIENEYGNYQKLFEKPDTLYLEQLRDLFIKKGVVELLFTSDTPLLGKDGSIPGILYTANFNYLPKLQLWKLDKYQPGKAAMVMEYWSGWFDSWGGKHNTIAPEKFLNTLETILKYPASVNFYMFIGGTSWGFMNGAIAVSIKSDNSGYWPDTNSYDYDAPLTEYGDYTMKYHGLKNLIEKYNDVKTLLPEMPPNTTRIAYRRIKLQGQLTMADLISQETRHLMSKNVVPMEVIAINNNSGQSYGYLVYQKKNIDIPAGSTLQIKGRVCDMVMVLINGKLVSKQIIQKSDMNNFGTWNIENAKLNLGPDAFVGATLELVAENMGRVNFGTSDNFKQYKGIWQGDVLLNGKVIYDWNLIPLEFKKSWTKSLTDWKTPDYSVGPILYKANLHVHDDFVVPRDTFIDMSDWKKGIVMVNGFVLSRYFRVGPQKMIYLPGPFLKIGPNEILIFEHFEAAKEITFDSRWLWKT